MVVTTRIHTSEYEGSFGYRNRPAPAGDGPSSVHFKCNVKAEYLSPKLGGKGLVTDRQDEAYTTDMKFFIYDPSVLLSYEALRRIVRDLDLCPDNWNDFTPHDAAIILRNRARGKANEGQPVGCLHLVMKMEMEVKLIYNEPEALLRACKEAVMQSTEPGSSEQCAICMEDFTNGAAPVDLPCSHAFHGDCITSWLHNGTACPVSRHDVRGLVAAPWRASFPAW